LLADWHFTVTASLYYIRVDHWLVNQHWVRWQGLGDTQRRARELISGPCLSAKARLLSEVCQPRCVFKLYGEVNLVKKHKYKIWLNDGVY